MGTATIGSETSTRLAASDFVARFRSTVMMAFGSPDCGIGIRIAGVVPSSTEIYKRSYLQQALEFGEAENWDANFC